MGALDRAWNRFWPGELLRAQGRYAEAVDVLRETLDSIDEGWTLHRSQTAFSLASALRGDGREQEAIEAAHLALGIVEAKGDIASTTKIRAFLDASS
jgi:tetratricopeptide (TPR) repeat protein